jgi:hypothetical protein
LAQFGRTEIEKDKTKFGNCSEELAVPADQFDVVDVIKARGPTTCGKKNNMMGGRMLHDSVNRRDFLGQCWRRHGDGFCAFHIRRRPSTLSDLGLREIDMFTGVRRWSAR